MFYLEVKVGFRGEWKRHFPPFIVSVVFDLYLAANSMEERRSLRVSEVRQFPEESERLEIPLSTFSQLESTMHWFLCLGF